MTLLAIDAHVHLHGRPDLRAVLHDAFGAARARLGEVPDRLVWMLADMPGQDGCGWLAEAAAEAGIAAERFADGGVPGVRLADGELQAVVFAGFQLVTAENLEVLALASVDAPPHGLPLRATVEACLEAGALPVVPWGVGKWLGRRGGVVADFIDTWPDPARVGLADNAHRPLAWPWPALLTRAERRGFAVLSGSDPLPLPGDERRIGSAGVAARCTGEPDLAAVRAALAHPSRRFGRPMPPARFVALQAALRVRRA